jgi:hypothetical protein
MINFFQNLALFLVKNVNFFAKNWEKSQKIEIINHKIDLWSP